MSQAREEISEWVEEYSDQLYTWAYHKTANKEIAEDLVQDTFVAAFKGYSGFKQDSQPKTWLFSILSNKINDHYRKQYKNPTNNESVFLATFFDESGHWKKDEAPASWDDQAEHLLDNLHFRQELLNCLDRLPPNWFSAINLKYLEGKKGKEICQELGIADTNYWQILHRAKLQLRKCLELNWFSK